MGLICVGRSRRRGDLLALSCARVLRVLCGSVSSAGSIIVYIL